jgi:hypothetical protein
MTTPTPPLCTLRVDSRSPGRRILSESSAAWTDARSHSRIPGASGFEPPLGLTFLAALAGGIWWTEGSGGNTGLFAGLALGQALVYTLLAGAAAAAIARLLWALFPRRAAWAAGLLSAALLGAALFPIYDTPLSSSRPRSNALQLFR